MFQKSTKPSVDTNKPKNCQHSNKEPKQTKFSTSKIHNISNTFPNIPNRQKTNIPYSTKINKLKTPTPIRPPRPLAGHTPKTAPPHSPSATSLSAPLSSTSTMLRMLKTLFATLGFLSSLTPSAGRRCVLRSMSKRASRANAAEGIKKSRIRVYFCTAALDINYIAHLARKSAYRRDRSARAPQHTRIADVRSTMCGPVERARRQSARERGRGAGRAGAPPTGRTKWRLAPPGRELAGRGGGDEFARRFLLLWRARRRNFRLRRISVLDRGLGYGILERFFEFWEGY